MYSVAGAPDSAAAASAVSEREIGRIRSRRTICDMTDLNSLYTAYAASIRPSTNSAVR